MCYLYNIKHKQWDYYLSSFLLIGYIKAKEKSLGNLKIFSCLPAQQNPTCLLHCQLSFSNQPRAVSFLKSKAGIFPSSCNFYFFYRYKLIPQKWKIDLQSPLHTLGRESSSDPLLPLPLAVHALPSTSHIFTYPRDSISVHPFSLSSLRTATYIF